MTTIDTIQDLSRVLRERPEWREELRRTLLTEELLELPQRFAEYTAKNDERMGTMEARMDALEVRMDALDARMDALAARMDALTESVTELTKNVAELTARMDALSRQVALNTRHIGDMKNRFMVRSVTDDAALIADDMGLTWLRTLNRADIIALANSAVASGKAASIPTNYLRRFRRADLMIEAADAQGGHCHIAVEISYTADERDTERSIRNAGYLTRFTDLPAYAAVASVHADNRIADILTQDAQPHGSAIDERAFHSLLPEAEPLD